MDTENKEKIEMDLLTSHPFQKKKIQSSTIMFYIILSLLPIIIFALHRYRINAVIHLIVTVVVCCGSEYLYEYLFKKEITIADGSAVLTGLLIFLMLPAYAPYWVGALGGVFAIIVVKHLFGGLGNVIVNPACSAICFLLISLPGYMDNYAQNGVGNVAYELLYSKKTVDTFELMMGNTDGAMGEICVVAILIGAVLLILTGVVDIYVPAVSIISFSFVVLFTSGRGFDFTYLTAQLACGGFLFVIWFIASDFSSAPITVVGQAVYGILIGGLIGVSRVFFGSDRAIYFIILFCNLCVCAIENLTIPRPLYKGGMKIVE